MGNGGTEHAFGASLDEGAGHGAHEIGAEALRASHHEGMGADSRDDALRRGGTGRRYAFARGKTMKGAGEPMQGKGPGRDRTAIDSARCGGEVGSGERAENGAIRCCTAWPGPT
jgi:hypothetical protein